MFSRLCCDKNMKLFTRSVEITPADQSINHLCVCVQGSASMVSATPAILLSSMTTEAVCERVRQIEGIDQSMMSQYSATIRKVGARHHGLDVKQTMTDIVTCPMCLCVVFRPTLTAESCHSATWTS